MSIYDAYRKRVNPKNSATPMQDTIKDTTKRQQTNLMLNSPSLSHITLNDEATARPAIVSDIDTFHKRRVLFLPDSVVNVGDYVKIQNDTYLATDMKKSEIHPELFVELCNETYILDKSTKVVVGKDSMGRPIYDIIENKIPLPCVLNTKGYTVAENAAISLPDGSAIVKLPYRTDLTIKVNDKLAFQNRSYEVRNISMDEVYKEKGYIEIQLQREVNPS